MIISAPKKPDYAEWMRRPLWTLYEAACLLCGIDPPPYNNKKILPSALVSDAPKMMYADLKSAAIDLGEIWCKKRLPDDPIYMYRVKPIDCITWASDREYKIPKPLLAYASKSTNTDASKVGEVEKKPQRLTWGEGELRQLRNESNEPGVTQQKLAEKYGVSRQRIGKLLKQASELFETKKSTPFDTLQRKK